MDINWRPRRQWRWTFAGMLLGYFLGTGFFGVENIMLPVLSMALGGMLLWFARFYEANFHDD
jgi:hypothetical protein